VRSAEREPFPPGPDAVRDAVRDAARNGGGERRGGTAGGNGGNEGCDEGDDGEAASVRLYTVTGGRTRPCGTDLPFEALVEALVSPHSDHSPESRRSLGLAAGHYLSVAELSAHLHLAVGAVRVLVGDLADEGAVRIHGLTATTSGRAPVTSLSVLEGVLDGISAL
jgi:hypothetical protein